MLRLKSCPKCRGDVFTSRDHYGQYEQCLQCGYLLDLEYEIESQRLIGEAEKSRKPVPAR